MHVELKEKESRGNAQRRFDEICRFILDGENNLTSLLVRYYRNSADPASAEAKSLDIFEALHECVADAEQAYKAVIQQPEPKVRAGSRATL